MVTFRRTRSRDPSKIQWLGRPSNSALQGTGSHRIGLGSGPNRYRVSNIQ